MDIIKMTPEQRKAHAERLRGAFERVENPQNWKDEIDKTLPTLTQPEMDEIAEAVEFFTATKATFTPIAGGGVRIQALGYWAGPAN